MPIKKLIIVWCNRYRLTGLILFFSFIQVTLYAQQLSNAIVFEERVFNFGTIQEKNGKVSHTFIFRNNRKTPVTINDIQSGCGCIGKLHATTPVKPGAKGKVTISFDPAYKEGFFSKEVIVFSDEGRSYNRVWVEGVINPADHPIEDAYPYNFGNGLYLRLKVMAFGYMKPGETRVMDLHYANTTRQQVQLEFKGGNSEFLKFKNPGKIEPGQKGVVRFSYTMPATSMDVINFLLIPYLNGNKLNESLNIRVLNANKQKQLSKLK